MLLFLWSLAGLTGRFTDQTVTRCLHSRADRVVLAADDNPAEGEQQHDELDHDKNEEKEKAAEVEMAKDQPGDENPEDHMDYANAPPFQQPSQEHTTLDVDNSMPAGPQGSQTAATKDIAEDSGML